MVALSELDKARAFILKAVLLPQRGIWEMRFLKKKNVLRELQTPTELYHTYVTTQRQSRAADCSQHSTH